MRVIVGPVDSYGLFIQGWSFPSNLSNLSHILKTINFITSFMLINKPYGADLDDYTHNTVAHLLSTA